MTAPAFHEQGFPDDHPLEPVGYAASSLDTSAAGQDTEHAHNAQPGETVRLADGMLSTLPPLPRSASAAVSQTAGEFVAERTHAPTSTPPSVPAQPRARDVHPNAQDYSINGPNGDELARRGLAIAEADMSIEPTALPESSAMVPLEAFPAHQGWFRARFVRDTIINSAA